MRAFVRLREIMSTHKDLARKLAELERKLGELAAGFEIGGHAIEGMDKFAHFAGGLLRDAFAVVAFGDSVHGLGEGLDRPSDLPGKEPGQPDA